MKILVEILNENKTENGVTVYNIDSSKTVEIADQKTDSTVLQAQTKLNELKTSLSPNQKIRVIEYHNDDPDETRTPCKVLYEP